MPKNEGGWTQKQSKESCSTKTEGISKQSKDSCPSILEVQDLLPTYQDLNITYKDVSRWQQMIEHEEEIKEKEIREKRIVTILQLHIFCFDVIFKA